MSPLAGLIVGYAFLPTGFPRDAGYVGIGVASMTVAFCGLMRHPPRLRGTWWLMLSGITGWVAGDALVLVQDRIVHTTAYPAPSDAAYIISYALIGAGLIRMVRRRGGHGDLAAVLDAAILATGVAVVAGVFVIAPAAMDSTLSLAGRLTSSLYPIADVLLIGILVRLWTTPGARTSAFRLLAGALGLTLLGDVVYNLRTILTANTASSALNDAMWLGSYVLVAGALWAPSIQHIDEVAPGREELEDPRRRLIVLTGGLLLPGLTLLVDGLNGGDLVWPVIAAGSILLSGLVLARMAGLLTVVSAQSVRLAALARSDPLTGVANRRTWDHELSRACRTARDQDSPLTVALIDLDHFKTYNDTFGHAAGDRLLREATAIWTDKLRAPELLSRYGGEEFAVLFPGQTTDQAQQRVQVLLAHTPGGQTFSAGLARWTPGTDPATAINDADRAMYEAKRNGRNQVRTCSPDIFGTSPAGPYCFGGSAAPLSPAVTVPPVVVLQPIVDLASLDVVGAEALSRFLEHDPAAVFANAYQSGNGPELEAIVVTAARAIQPPEGFLSVNLALEALTDPHVRRALAGDLSRIVLEITEHTAAHNPIGLQEALEDYRSRGAVVAVDDWGTGHSDTPRLLLLQPEIVKIDMSIVQGSHATNFQGAIAGLLTWAATTGARVCAEGIETHDQHMRMRDLGVQLGQGYLFGRPAAPNSAPRAAAATDVAGEG